MTCGHKANPMKFKVNKNVSIGATDVEYRKNLLFHAADFRLKTAFNGTEGCC